jgi:transposase InsO family protein
MPSTKQPETEKEIDMHFNTDQFANTGPRATRKNQIWSIELVLLDIPGRPTVWAALDVFSRLPVVLDTTSRKIDHIVFNLDHAGRRGGYPERLWVDRGYEFRSQQLQQWADLRGVELVFGAPIWRKAVAERFLRQLSLFVRDNGLTNPADFKRKLAEWHQAYEEAATAAIN